MKRLFQDITNTSTLRKNIKVTIHKSSQRKKLIRWLYEVVKDFRYSQITYALSIHILDRYIRTHGLDLSKYQLIGISALFVAAKLEEPSINPINEYVTVTDNTCCALDILRTEKEILTLFGFHFQVTLPHNYLTEEYLLHVSRRCCMGVRECCEVVYVGISRMLESEEGVSCYGVFERAKGVVERMVSRDVDEDLRFYMQRNPTTCAML